MPAAWAPQMLRKSCLRRLAEAGCTAPEIMAVSGHKSLAEVERYIRQAEQKLLADRAIARTTFTHTVKPKLPTKKSMKYPLDRNALRFRGNDTDLEGYDGSAGTVQPSCAASPAGLSETDSPQPQALRSEERRVG